MITRIAFDSEFVHAMRLRGLTLTVLAQRAGVNIATASAAVHGRPVNVRTALQLSRAVVSAPVIPELEAWARELCTSPAPTNGSDLAAETAAVLIHPRRRRPPRHLPADKSGPSRQLPMDLR